MKRFLLIAVALMGLASTASAEGLYVKQSAVLWARSTGTVQLANGVRDNVAGVAPAATTRDTSGAFDVRDHWTTLRRATTVGPNGGAAGSLLQDTTGSFGTLSLRSTKHSLDSLVIVRQWSSDAVRWNTVDSIGGHWVYADTIFSSSSAASDSIMMKLTTAPAVLMKNGIAQRVVNYQWNCNPWYGPDIVTSQATVGVNFIRFIITMTNGDYVGAGRNDGWTGQFSYIAVKP